MIDSKLALPSPLHEIAYAPVNQMGIKLLVKRDDLIHPVISGNKWRKLQWNIAQAQFKGHNTLLTFGGAFSNHLLATACAASLFGMKSIGVVRGMASSAGNYTLNKAREFGMQLIHVSKDDYGYTQTYPGIEELRQRFGGFYAIAEGGANHYGVQGCQTILSEIQEPFNRLFTACGTGTTLSGLALANRMEATLAGVPVLRGGDFIRQVVYDQVNGVIGDELDTREVCEHVEILSQYHFGGYAKINDELIKFMRQFFAETGIKLDPVYTAKAAYALVHQASHSKLDNPETWVLLHTGGLQGIEGMETRLGVRIYDEC